MQGYYRKPEETTKVIDADGWLHSGDVGWLRADGCLCFLGRYKVLVAFMIPQADVLLSEQDVIEQQRGRIASFNFPRAGVLG